MSVTLAVPRVVVVWARSHYRRARRPYLFSARQGDVRFDASPGSRGRYLLTLDPDRGAEMGLLDLTEGDTAEDRAAHALLMLADAVVCAIGCEPVSFVCEAQQVGRIEIIKSPFGGHAVRVRGYVSLTCLSWVLHKGRSGYFLALPDWESCR